MGVANPERECIGILLGECRCQPIHCGNCWYSRGKGKPTLAKVAVFHQIRVLKEEYKVVSRTGPGGKFDSIGNKSQQQENLALAVRLLGEIGADGKEMVPTNERLFLIDCMIKINQEGTRATFGWKQVEELVRIHAEVMYRKEREGDGSRTGNEA
jgi:hypothetical protein